MVYIITVIFCLSRLLCCVSVTQTYIGVTHLAKDKQGGGDKKISGRESQVAINSLSFKQMSQFNKTRFVLPSIVGTM